jgi:hypothetical protein
MSEFGQMYILNDDHLRSISAKIVADERMPKDNVDAVLQHFVYLAAADYADCWFTEEQAKRTIEAMGYDSSMVGVMLSLRLHGKLRRQQSRKQPYGYVDYYRIEKRAEIDYEQKLNAPREPEPETQEVSQSLEDLQKKVANPEERVFLDETLNCLRAKAFRAAIVMGWNLAYDHIRQWILRKNLPAFNAELAKVLNRGSPAYDPVATIEDFPHKESLVLETCYKAGLITDGNKKKVLNKCLDNRNSFAHPSTMQANSPIAAGHISELLVNVVLDSCFS